MPNGSTSGRPGRYGTFGRQDGKPEVYRSPTAILVWWVWVAFAVANLADLAVQGRDHFAAMVAAILVLVTGVTYVAALRPRVSADDEGMTIINPVRDWRVPWNCIERITLGDSLEVFCNWQDDAVGSNGSASNGSVSNGSASNGFGPGGGAVRAGNRQKKLYGWAVHSPRRSRLKAEMRAHRQAMSAQRRHSKAYSQLPQEAKEAMTKTDVEHIAASLEGRANNARSAGIATRGPVGTWDRLAIAVIVIPALLVLVVGLIP